MIDATGQVVAPGFVDPHGHSDGSVLLDGALVSHLRQGFTTQLPGNCGYTLAPVRRHDQDYLMGLFAAAEEIPKKALQLFAPFPWETFPEFLDSMEGRVGVNVVAQIGQSAVRRFVMGEAALERAATPDEVAEMVALVEAAIDCGAIDRIHLHKAAALMALGRTEKAVQEWSLALRRDPELPEAYLGRARAHLSLSRWDLALADLEQQSLDSQRSLSEREHVCAGGDCNKTQ